MKANLIEKISFCSKADENSGDEIEFDGKSRLFGTAFLPEKWLETNEFSPFEFYVGMINLSEFSGEENSNSENLSDGFLYFFAEAKNFDFSRLCARVRFFSGEADAYTDFNEGFFDDDEAEKRSFIISPSVGGDDCVMFSDGDDLVLLSIKKEFLPFEIDGEKLEFRIKKSDFCDKKLDNCVIKIK